MSTNLVALAKQCAQVTSDPGQRATEQDALEGEVPDIIVEEPEEEERGWTSRNLAEQLEEVLIQSEDPTKTVKVGGGLDSEIKKD